MKKTKKLPTKITLETQTIRVLTPERLAEIDGGKPTTKSVIITTGPAPGCC